MKRFWRIMVLVVALLTLWYARGDIARAVSYIAGAFYYGTITVHNTGNASENVSTNISGLNTGNMISLGYLNAGANDTALRSPSGTDVPFMPGLANNSWVMFVSSVGAQAQDNYTLYLTNNVTGGNIVYFPDTPGMTTPISATLGALE